MVLKNKDTGEEYIESKESKEVVAKQEETREITFDDLIQVISELNLRVTQLEATNNRVRGAY